MNRFLAGSSALVEGPLRRVLAPRVYTLPMVRAIGRTMVQGKNYGPQITVKRLSTRCAAASVVRWGGRGIALFAFMPVASL